MTANHSDRSQLIHRCLLGHDDARAEFIASYDGLIRRAVARRIERAASARAQLIHIDDIVNEVYIKLFAHQCQALASVRDAKRLDAWLVTVAQNQAVTFLRKQGVSVNTSDGLVREEAAPFDQAPDQQAISHELVEHVSRALAQLDDKDRLVLQMFYLYNLRYTDIALSLDMNINTVASRILRAKQKLREWFEEHPV